MSLTTIKPIVRQGLALYPNKHMRKQWVRKYAYLVESGRHVALNGKYPEPIVHQIPAAIGLGCRKETL
jgi:hypothetical protein